MVDWVQRRHCTKTGYKDWVQRRETGCEVLALKWQRSGSEQQLVPQSRMTEEEMLTNAALHYYW